MDDILDFDAADKRITGLGVTSFVNSRLFTRLYDQAMDMVREAADYLELEGVLERDALPKDRAMVYACESMRLTTRLMQISAWLLAMRAMQEEGLSDEELVTRRSQLGGRDVCLGGPVRGAGLLPATLIELLGVSKQLYERVMRIDTLLFYAQAAQDAEQNPVDAHLDRIEQAFAL